MVIEHGDIIGEQFWRSNAHIILGKGDGSCEGGEGAVNDGTGGVGEIRVAIEGAPGGPRS